VANGNCGKVNGCRYVALERHKRDPDTISEPDWQTEAPLGLSTSRARAFKGGGALHLEHSMDEPIQTFDLSPEQQNTTTLIQRLLGKRIADRYVDFCRLTAGAFALRVSSPIAAHALRELESILRQTLEVPMDVAITPSQEQIDRIEKAKAQLKTLGFNDGEIHRVANQLRPRLSHRAEIEMIVTRLDLAPNGDIAQAWKSISQAHSQAHGGRALHQSFVVDDMFRADWQVPFDTVIRGLMIAERHRGRRPRLVMDPEGGD
jgi:hypothetical protein